MNRKIIKKSHASLPVPPNLADYAEARADFSWEAARAQLAGLPNGSGLNIAHEAVDRHAAGPRAGHVALRWIDRQYRSHDYSYQRLRELSNRFANLLKDLGIDAGDRVFSLTSRIPELYITALGTLKHRGLFSPLFAAFGPEPIRTRLQLGKARVLVTTDALYRRKVAQLRPSLPELEHVLIVGRNEAVDAPPHTLDFHRLLAVADPDYSIQPTDPESMALLHFTSGTTGPPKGAIHVHQAVIMHQLSGRLALDLHPEDIFWCTADPGWVTGTSYGIIAPLTLGATLIVDSEEFEAERWYRILQQQQVSVWYTAPTAVRMLMRLGADLAGRYAGGKLRYLASVGEPLNPEAVRWGQQAFGLPFHDNWWQTETGAIMISNYPSMDIKPGSMGRPLPGIEAAIVRRTPTGEIEFIEQADSPGELALRRGWPSMFRGYLDEPVRYRDCFAGDWYLSGDLATRDGDGYYWFVGRADDVIKTAGHLIGPFEVESVLLEHPAVTEAGVIGIPDPVVMQVVKAFVALKPDYLPSEELRRELLGYARKRLGSIAAPRVIEFRSDLPKTRSGKIMRRLLRAREFDQPEGDLSTLEQNT
ncbi:MAG: acetate--CoA ligase [Chromatiales bacterium]|jgi:acetyl-CoA synthetase